LAFLAFDQVDVIAKGEMDGHDSCFPGTTKSALMRYILSDGDKGTFVEGKTIHLSPLFEEKVYTKSMANLWGMILSHGEDDWKTFEAYTHSLMATKGRRQLSFQCHRCVGKIDIGSNTKETLKLGAGNEIQVGLNPFMKANAEWNATGCFIQ
jgi:hypothetical protein